MKQAFSKSGSARLVLKPRQAVSCHTADLVRFDPVEQAFPAVARPAVNGVNLIAWAQAEREMVRSTLLRHGAILFRGFDLRTAPDLERFIVATSDRLLPYVERSSPRTAISGHIYSSTEYPAEHSISMHCENSYQSVWPLRIFFCCETQPERGGETPIADTRRILSRINSGVRDKFARKGVMYVRNFGAGLGLSWQTVFQTENRRTIEEYCHRQGIECIWREVDRLRIRQIRKAIHTHPVTGEEVWFNHAMFFHVSSLDRATCDALRESIPEEDLPNNTYYGDGSPIEPDVLDHLRAVYKEHTVYFPWHRGDVLMLDNMLAAHGRAPYRGARKILVGMSEPHSD